MVDSVVEQFMRKGCIVQSDIVAQPNHFDELSNWFVQLFFCLASIRQSLSRWSAGAMFDTAPSTTQRFSLLNYLSAFQEQSSFSFLSSICGGMLVVYYTWRQTGWLSAALNIFIHTLMTDHIFFSCGIDEPTGSLEAPLTSRHSQVDHLHSTPFFLSYDLPGRANGACMKLQSTLFRMNISFSDFWIETFFLWMFQNFPQGVYKNIFLP